MALAWRLCFLVFVYTASTSALRCMDENNKPVDWYVLYKLPKVPQSKNPLLKNGVAYLYITSNSSSSGWKLSNKDISQKDSVPGNTLAALYNDTEAAKKLWLMYNDSPPTKPSRSSYGHTKGVVATDKRQGFWMIHSVPNYPPMPNTGNGTGRSASYDDNEDYDLAKIVEGEAPGKYDYPSSGRNFGQSFLCISLDGDQLDPVGRQLMYNQIIVYRRNLPAVLSQQFPVLSDAANQVRVKEGPYNHMTLIKSSRDLEFISFAKSSKWQQDLYDDFVAPKLKSDFLTETWLNGRGRLTSDCNGTKVMNVESVILKAANMDFSIDFSSSRDHSKWAVATKGSKNKTWVCVGDINRATTQYHRGGGTVCFNLPDVWKNYRESVNDVEPCHYNG